MRSKKMFLIAISAIGVLLTACVHTTYMYNNAKFDSAESAFAAQEAEQAEMLSKIAPLQQSLDKSAIVILPSAALIENSGIQKRGNPREEVVKFLVTGSQNSHMGMAKAIKKRQIFKSVQIVQNDKPEDTVFSEDVAVYLAMPSPGLSQWYVKKKNELKPTPINMDKGLPTADQRTMSWLESIERAVR